MTVALRSLDVSARSVVAWRGGAPLRGPAAALDVGCVAGALDGALDGSDAPPRVVLVTRDAYAFTCGLLAIWQVGGTAILPPGPQPAAVATAARSADAAIFDAADTDLRRALATLAAMGPYRRFPVGGPDPSVLTLAPLRRGHDTPGDARDAAAVELVTSGSTGERKRVTKTFAQLEAELTALEARFGALLPPEAPVFGSVSPQHIYGLLFRVLWPLTTGRALVAETHVYPEELAQALGPHATAALVSCPAHLSRLHQLVDLRATLGRCALVTSSGGPLEPETAGAFLAVGLEPPLEVFGSTETGGVAWRRQRPDDGPEGLAFTPLPGVRVTAEGDDRRLTLRSPWAGAVGPGSAMRMGDAIEPLPGGRFLLRGRLDRIVKVAEKRLSLPAMERALAESPLVRDARIEPLAADARTGACLVLTDAGRERYERAGRAALARDLRAHLASGFDRVTLPRAWRVVRELPRDPQGKVDRAAVLARLALRFDPDRRDPFVLERRRDGDALEQDCRVPEDLGACAGHFQAFAVVPGVVQLRWVFAQAAALLGTEPVAARLEAVKFKELLTPGAPFTLRVQLRAGPPRKLAYRLTQGETEFSSGRIVLREAPATPLPTGGGPTA